MYDRPGSAIWPKPAFGNFCVAAYLKTKWKYKGSSTNSPPQLRCVAKVNDKLLLKLAPEE
jgi:hypothetical protein